MRFRGTNKKRILFAVLNILLSVFSLGCFIAVAVLGGKLESQKQAIRWQGESEMEFTQLSFYIPVDNKMGLEQVQAFRSSVMDKVHEAALDVDKDNQLMVDAWSTTGKLKVSSTLGSGDASVIAVGGNFFDFHPIRLISGSYISANDVMQDRVLLDEDLAWLLFGGTELQGMSFRINGIPFVVAGVIRRETDFASELAYTSGMGLYMSYDAYAQLDENAGISCYELVMPEPVDDFAMNFAKEKFPIKGVEILENTDRYGFEGLLKVIGGFGKRSMQSMGLIYPYWENAARCIEDWSALLLFLGLLAVILPIVTLTVIVLRYIRRGKNKVEDEVLPRIKENTQEAIRVRQRKRWEKKYGKHEKR